MCNIFRYKKYKGRNTKGLNVNVQRQKVSTFSINRVHWIVNLKKGMNSSISFLTAVRYPSVKWMFTDGQCRFLGWRAISRGRIVHQKCTALYSPVCRRTSARAWPPLKWIADSLIWHRGLLSASFSWQRPTYKMKVIAQLNCPGETAKNKTIQSLTRSLRLV